MEGNLRETALTVKETGTGLLQQVRSELNVKGSQGTQEAQVTERILGYGRGSA